MLNRISNIAGFIQIVFIVLNWFPNNPAGNLKSHLNLYGCKIPELRNDIIDILIFQRNIGIEIKYCTNVKPLLKLLLSK